MVNATLTESGIVSLAAHHDLIKSARCFQYGTIQVKMEDNVDLSMEELFPTGAILVVSSAVFGSCSPFPPEESFPGTKIFPDEEDGFLRILSQEGTSQDGIVIGDVVTFLTLFDDLHVEAYRIETENDENVDYNGVRRLQTLFFKEYDLNEETTIKLTARFGASSNSFIRGFLIGKGNDGWEYRVMTLLNFDVNF